MRLIADGDTSVRNASVLQSVGEGFLHDPVGSQIEPGRQRHRLAFDPDIDGEAGLAHLLTEHRHLGDAGQGFNAC